jgi:hypothetical protein
MKQALMMMHGLEYGIVCVRRLRALCVNPENGEYNDDKEKVKKIQDSKNILKV